MMREANIAVLAPRCPYCSGPPTKVVQGENWDEWGCKDGHVWLGAVDNDDDDDDEAQTEPDGPYR